MIPVVYLPGWVRDCSCCSCHGRQAKALVTVWKIRYLVLGWESVLRFLAAGSVADRSWPEIDRGCPASDRCGPSGCYSAIADSDPGSADFDSVDPDSDPTIAVDPGCRYSVAVGFCLCFVSSSYSPERASTFPATPCR